MEAIIAIDTKNGLSKGNKIPWNCEKDIKFFNNTTINNTVIYIELMYNILIIHFKFILFNLS